MTLAELRKAEADYHRSAKLNEKRRERRNALLRAAIASGYTHAQISDATGLSRGRIGQLANT